MSSINGNKVFRTITGNRILTIPPNCAIAAICVKNNTARSVLGGIRIGTTDGGSEVLAVFPIPGNFMNVIETELGLRWFSTTEDTVLYLQTVTSWNSVELEVTICLINLD